MHSLVFALTSDGVLCLGHDDVQKSRKGAVPMCLSRNAPLRRSEAPPALPGEADAVHLPSATDPVPDTSQLERCTSIPHVEMASESTNSQDYLASRG